MRPRVSVLLPVRDGARHLPECIQSLEAQTLEDVEYVVVDDDSRDDTPSILSRWAREDPRVRIVRRGAGFGGDDHALHAGPCATRLVASLELGRSVARAPVLARMDHDDVALPDRLSSQFEFLEARPGVALCGCGVEYFPSEGLGAGSRRYQAWLNALVGPTEIERDLFVECPLAHPTFMMRAEAVESVGGYRDFGGPEDYDLLLRLWEAGGGLAKVPEILLRWRDRPDRLSRISNAYAPAAFRRLKARVLARTILEGRDVVIWGAGPTGKAFSRTLAGAGVSVRAFVDLDPRKIGQAIHGAPVVSPDGVDRYRGCYCLAAVGREGAREEIRAELGTRGWHEMTDFCAVA